MPKFVDATEVYAFQWKHAGGDGVPGHILERLSVAQMRAIEVGDWIVIDDDDPACDHPRTRRGVEVISDTTFRSTFRSTGDLPVEKREPIELAVELPADFSTVDGRVRVVFSRPISWDDVGKQIMPQILAQMPAKTRAEIVDMLIGSAPRRGGGEES